MTVLHLDFETRSRCDLFGRGLHAYSRDPSTQALMLGYAIDSDAPCLWLPGESRAPVELREAMRDPTVVKLAWNAPFEMAIMRNVLKSSLVGPWRDVMVMAYYASLPGGLADAGKAIGLAEDQQKLSDGKRLIRKFSVPHKPSKKFPGEWRDKTTDPEDWERFCEYCLQDVSTERTIFHKLERYPVPEHEWRLWELDMEINERGLPVDLTFVREAARMTLLEKARLTKEFKQLTGLPNSTTAHLLPWLRERGYPFNDLRKATVKIALAEHPMEDEAKHALALRSGLSKNSTSKFEALIDKVSEGRLHYSYQFGGASRTLRWAGRGVQPQNLPRPEKFMEGRLAEGTDLVRAGEYDELYMRFGPVLPVLSSLVRSSFRAPDGRVLAVADLNAIENRVLGWLARCRPTLEVFEKDLCPYKSFGVRLYETPYEQITKEQRTNSKPAVLGCFAADTEVLTKRGWVPIIELSTVDWLHDGIEWVRHDGVVDQGVKRVIDFAGVRCTPDHLILTEDGWKPADHVAQDETSFRSALSLVRGLSEQSNTSKIDAGGIRTRTSASVGAERLRLCRAETLSAGSLNRAFDARISGFSRHADTWRSVLGRIRCLSNGYPIGSTPYGLVASEGVVPTPGTPVAGSSAGSTAPRTSFGTALRSTGTMIRRAKLTGLTTTATTPPGTFVSRLEARMSEIAAPGFGAFLIAGKHTSAKISGGSFARGIRALRQCFERRAQAFRRKLLSRSKPVAEVRTYDVLNAGPRNRFVIRTTRGPVIAHNCGYRLGGGEIRESKAGDLVKTGLWGYAENMGIKMTQEEAHRAVRIFREAYPAVVQFWYDLEEAAHYAVTEHVSTRVGYVVFDYQPGVMRIRLPSGRHLHYLRPAYKTVTFKGKDKITGEPTEWQKEVLFYDGMDSTPGGNKRWACLATHGGRVAENLCQAVARDVLAVGLVRAKKAGFEIIGHAHDEIITEVDEGSALTHERLGQLMSQPIRWAPGLPLAAAGYTSKFYKKD